MKLIKDEFAAVLKGIDLSAQVDNDMPSKFLIEKWIEWFEKVSEVNSLLSKEFKHFYQVFSKLIKYFDGIKNILELIVTNKNDKFNKELSDEEGKFEDNKDDSVRSDSSSDIEKNLTKPYFEYADYYLEALSQFVLRFDTKEKFSQDRILDLEAQLNLKEEEFQSIRYEIRQYKQN